MNTDQRVTGQATPGEALTVVGAGLVGSLLALLLARRGFRVDVFERRSDMRKEAISAGRSINLAISLRGLNALDLVGLQDEVLAQAVPMRGRQVHMRSGEQRFQPYGKDASQCINSVSRGDLNRMLMSRAEATGRVRFYFHERADAVALKTGTVHFVNELTGALRQVTGLTAFGTDGGGSAIRNALVEQGAATAHTAVLEYGYKELHIPSGPGGAFRIEQHALHIWPRGTFMLIALPNVDGSFTCTLFLPHKPSANAPSFAELQTAAAVRAFFEREFADAVPLMPGLEEAFFANPTGHMATVKAAPWHAGGRVLLVGDAAHAIVPFFGQGMNCGFEDCAVLDELLAREPPARPDWERVFATLSSGRKPDADAIADMAVENFTEMRDKVGDARFLLEKAVEKVLEREFPGAYLSRYTLVTFTRAPYRVALAAGAVQASMLAELCSGIGDAEDVDLAKAGRLIRERLGPVLGDLAGAPPRGDQSPIVP